MDWPSQFTYLIVLSNIDTLTELLDYDLSERARPWACCPHWSVSVEGEQGTWVKEWQATGRARWRTREGKMASQPHNLKHRRNYFQSIFMITITNNIDNCALVYCSYQYIVHQHLTIMINWQTAYPLFLSKMWLLVIDGLLFVLFVFSYVSWNMSCPTKMLFCTTSMHRMRNHQVLQCKSIIL